MITKEFLGIGWTFPVITTLDKSISLSQHEKDIDESIQIILSTSKGERQMQPNFGCNLRDYVFESMSSLTVGRIKKEIRDALFTWEPRIEVLDVGISDNELANGKLLITVDYVVSATNSRRNLVYDFYLKEG